jgi:hypothetical protein
LTALAAASTAWSCALAGGDHDRTGGTSANRLIRVAGRAVERADGAAYRGAASARRAPYAPSASTPARKAR